MGIEYLYQNQYIQVYGNHHYVYRIHIINDMIFLKSYLISDNLLIEKGIHKWSKEGREILIETELTKKLNIPNKREQILNNLL